jgi:hypothetical protein
MTISHFIIALTALGYFIVGMQQFFLKNTAGGIIWTSYACSNVGLYLTLKSV